MSLWYLRRCPSTQKYEELNHWRILDDKIFSFHARAVIVSQYNDSTHFQFIQSLSVLEAFYASVCAFVMALVLFETVHLKV